MKVKYSYTFSGDDPEFETFNSLTEFFNDKRGKMFEQLLSDGREKVTDKITIETSYPSTITIELEKSDDL